MQEMHVVRNTDGSYTADIVANFGRQGLQRFQTPRCFIKVENMVLDQKEQMPPMVEIHMGDIPFAGGFQFK